MFERYRRYLEIGSEVDGDCVESSGIILSGGELIAI